MVSFGRGVLIGGSRVYDSKCGKYRIKKRSSAVCYILYKVVAGEEIALHELRNLADAKWLAGHVASKPEAK